MGYRNYIGIMPKKDYNKIKSLTKQEVYDYYKVKSDFEDEEPYIGVYDFGKELYELGKYVDFNPPKGSVKPFFKKKDTQDRWEGDNELNIVTKEFLGYVIDSYKERIKTYYNDILIPFFGEKADIYKRDKPSDFLNSVKHTYDENFDPVYSFDFSKLTQKETTALFKIIDHVKSMRLEWIHKTYDLDRGDEVTTSWKYEYVIFELVRIYKNFDWKKNVMIYYGY